MVDDLPDNRDLVNIVAKVHRASMGKSPTGKFGFAVPTHLANIPNDNTWQDTWEKWFTQAMQSMYEFEKQAQGADEELDGLFDALCKKVIPRLLRPLETGGRSVEPCIVHSDLWPGTCMLDADTGEIIIFDSCAFWGHNEADLVPGGRCDIGLEDHILSSTRRSWEFRSHMLIGMTVTRCTLCEYSESARLKGLTLIASGAVIFWSPPFIPTRKSFARCMLSTHLVNGHFLT
jgi:hypothetical protein